MYSLEYLHYVVGISIDLKPFYSRKFKISNFSLLCYAMCQLILAYIRFRHDFVLLDGLHLAWSGKSTIYIVGLLALLIDLRIGANKDFALCVLQDLVIDLVLHSTTKTLIVIFARYGLLLARRLITHTKVEDNLFHNLNPTIKVV